MTTGAFDMPARAHPGRPVLAGALVAGTLDLIYICTLWAIKGVGPVRILQSVAAGWVGREAAVASGYVTATLGLVSHYLIAAGMAFAYFLAAARLPALARHPLRYGPLYGIALYLAMNFVVVPLSAAGTGTPKDWTWIELCHLAAHMFLVGTPIAWFVHRAMRPAR